MARSMLWPGLVIDIFAAVNELHTALDYHLERHNVLSSNIAHVDTPGFKPKDLERIDPSTTSFDTELGLAMKRTDPKHIQGADAGDLRVGRMFTDATGGGGADGNYVSMEREAGKLASNQLRYDIVSALTSSELHGLLWAANDGKSG